MHAIWFVLRFMIPCMACFALAAQEVKPRDVTLLTGDRDFAKDMIAGIDRFLLDEIQRTRESRAACWSAERGQPDSGITELDNHRRRLKQVLAAGATTAEFSAPELIATTEFQGPVATGFGYSVHAIRWPVLSDPAPTGQQLTSIHGEGLMLVPDDRVVGNIIALPDASQFPEQICGIIEGQTAAAQYARRAVECGFRVIVPVVISRDSQARNGRAVLSHREYLHRSSFVLGRHLHGYELSKIFSLIDWFKRQDPNLNIGVMGYGEGGLLSLYAGALDTRISATCVSGAAGLLENMWQQPLDRNVFGLLNEFGCAELCAMILPRKLVV